MALIGVRRTLIKPQRSVILPLVSFVSHIPATNSGSAFTATGVNIGNPTYIGTRRVIVFIIGGGGGNVINAGSSAINGVAPDNVMTFAAGTGLDRCYIMSGVVPSGTTGVSITAQLNSSTFGAATFAIYNVDNTTLNSATPVSGSTEVSAATTGSTTVNSLAGGFILAGCAAASGISASSITASTETYATDFTNESPANRNSAAHVNGVPARVGSSITWSWTGSATVVIALAAFR